MFRSTSVRMLRYTLDKSSSRKYHLVTEKLAYWGLPRHRASVQPFQSSQKFGMIRALSSKEDSGSSNKQPESEETKEIVLTPGEAVVVYSRLGMWAGIFAFAGVCAYYIGLELFPSKMSPNNVFDKALQVVRNDSGVRLRYGETIKGYGRDHGGHREGRRNFIEHNTYTNKEDDSKRTRVRFNIEGRNGNAFVFAEVSSKMPSGEFVYVLVQDKSNGRVDTIVDNRSALRAQQLSGGNKEGLDVMAQLLGGGKK